MSDCGCPTLEPICIFFSFWTLTSMSEGKGLKMRMDQKFLFLFKSKYRRKWTSFNYLLSCYLVKGLLSQPPKSLGVGRHGRSRIYLFVQVLGLVLTLYAIPRIPSVEGTEVTSTVNHNIHDSPLKDFSPSPTETSNCEPVSLSANDTTSLSIPSCHGHGDCVDNSCICHDGWNGTYCEHCYGKVRYGVLLPIISMNIISIIISK